MRDDDEQGALAQVLEDRQQAPEVRVVEGEAPAIELVDIVLDRYDAVVG